MEESNLPPKTDYWKAYMNWLSKNMFTMLGIIIIMGLVLFEMATVETQKVNIAKKCNDYWVKQVEKVCPALTSSNPLAGATFNSSLMNDIGQS